MSAPENLDRAQADGWDDTPLRCVVVGCGVSGSPDDGDFVETQRGLMCKHCFENGESL